MNLLLCAPLVLCAAGEEGPAGSKVRKSQDSARISSRSATVGCGNQRELAMRALADAAATSLTRCRLACDSGPDSASSSRHWSLSYSSSSGHEHPVSHGLFFVYVCSHAAHTRRQPPQFQRRVSRNHSGDQGRGTDRGRRRRDAWHDSEQLRGATWIHTLVCDNLGLSFVGSSLNLF